MKLEKDQQIAAGFFVFSVVVAAIILVYGLNEGKGRNGFLIVGALALVSLLYFVGGSRFRRFADPICRRHSRAGFGPDLSPRQIRWALFVIVLVLLIGAGVVYSMFSQPFI